MAKTKEVKLSAELYGKIQTVIDELDKRFFSGAKKEKIPQLVFAINNKCRTCVVAYVQPDALYDKKTDTKLQYMGINPDYLDRKLEEIISTVCHELCHVYEHAYIHIPRGGYHDKQWAELMRDCGLEPKYQNSSKTAVTHTVIKDGVFEKFVSDFKEKYGEDYFNIVSYSAEVARRTRKELGIEDDEDDSPRADNADKPIKVYNRNKIKYVCASCGMSLWGKGNLYIICGNCSEQLEEITDVSKRNK